MFGRALLRRVSLPRACSSLLPRCKTPQRSLSSDACDDALRPTVAVVGGSVVGLCTALHLHELDPSLKIQVFERDCSYAHASAMQSAGGIRQQFSLRENIEMSLYGISFLREIKERLAVESSEDGASVADEVDVQLHEHGYLFLASKQQGVVTLRRNNTTQRELGCDWISLLNPDELALRFPWLNVQDIEMGSFGEKNEGWFDPWALVCALRKKLQSEGVQIRCEEVTGASKDDVGFIKALHSKDASGTEYTTDVWKVVNAAGPFATQLLERLGIDTPLPVRPRKRCIFSVHCDHDDAPPPTSPLLVDPSGVYMRPEGGHGHYICGVSPTSLRDPDYDSVEGLCMTEADHELFEEIIWPTLYERIPAFESLKVNSAWAGYYDYNTFDQNGIIDECPGCHNVILANGFSGHGLQQSPAAGRAAAELVLERRFVSIPLERFGFQRVLHGEPLYEDGIV